MNNERDELGEILHQKITDRLPALPTKRVIGEYVDAAISAAIKAGYRKPRKVTTADEMEALPVGSVVLDRDGMALQKTEWRFRGTGWNALNGTRDIYREELERDCFPATILHEATA